MSRIALVRIDDSNCFAVPVEQDKEGVRITGVYIDENRLTESSYVNYGPRKIGVNIRVPEDTVVEAEIEEL